ncbi:MAG TPA: SRPBCC family protein [Mucilaginibacter sp.]|nr:SRPBCC family protein [Mucilaginibacter sp.]
MNHNDTTADHEVVIVRTLGAPRELVFKAFTDPVHLAKWWGCNACTCTFHEVDIRPGGMWRFTMHVTGGVDFPNLVKFTEVIEPERLEYEHSLENENGQDKFNVVITFEVLGNKTRLTMRSIFRSAAIRDLMVKQYGVIEGGNQTIDRLEQELLKMKPIFINQS